MAGVQRKSDAESAGNYVSGHANVTQRDDGTGAGN